MTGSRRFVAFGVLAGLAVVVLRSYVSVDGEVCRQAAGADRGTINLCGPIGPADLPALAVALLVALILFLPDLSELDIAGLVTLKRAVAEQKKETDQLRSLVQAISLRQETNITLYPRDLGEAADDVDRKSAAAGSGRLNGAITESDGSSRTDTSDSEVLHHPIDPTRAVARIHNHPPVGIDRGQAGPARVSTAPQLRQAHDRRHACARAVARTFRQ